jgi:hypothetical protein
MLHNKFVKHFLSTSPPACSKKQEFDELRKEVENFSSRLEAKVNGLTEGSSVYKFVSSRNEY